MSPQLRLLASRSVSRTTDGDELRRRGLNLLLTGLKLKVETTSCFPLVFTKRFCGAHDKAETDRKQQINKLSRYFFITFVQKIQKFLWWVFLALVLLCNNSNCQKDSKIKEPERRCGAALRWCRGLRRRRPLQTNSSVFFRLHTIFMFLFGFFKKRKMTKTTSSRGAPESSACLFPTRWWTETDKRLSSSVKTGTGGGGYISRWRCAPTNFTKLRGPGGRINTVTLHRLWYKQQL